MNVKWLTRHYTVVPLVRLLSGMAGGRPTVGGGEGKYFPTKFAKQGALGSKVLPPAPSGTVWTAGGTAVTGISIRANHGGTLQLSFLFADE